MGKPKKAAVEVTPYLDVSTGPGRSVFDKYVRLDVAPWITSGASGGPVDKPCRGSDRPCSVELVFLSDADAKAKFKMREGGAFVRACGRDKKTKGALVRVESATRALEVSKRVCACVDASCSGGKCKSALECARTVDRKARLGEVSSFGALAGFLR